MDQITLLKKKQIVGLIILLVLIASLPVALYLARQTQIFRPRATEEQIQFFGKSPECLDCGETRNLSGGRVGFTLNSQDEAKIGIRLSSPLGPPASPSAATTGGSQ